MKIAVIGSGAIGVNIAYRLAAKGAEVSLVEARSQALRFACR
jgi:ketopantoate reductase